ncbi:S8 family peptidase [Crossiella cryophila]|uniref:Subtilisin family serine protease n=1 Tax=Crossiella cryophila TaxID=43355 RepID=A0A7W7FYC0_9PSEU|nr:S8 family serine peptidase [Crossiella cryophila]MBB4681518.1 subtilisin family serine protease [Crossiella cryophila]
MAALVLVAALLPVGEPAMAAPAASPVATKDSRTVTLVTGDRVLLNTGRDGAVTVLVQPAPGREHLGFVRETSTGKHGVHHRVVPADAVPLLNEGRLDPRLFDVTALAAQRSADTPLILTGARAASPVGAKPVRALPAINGAAVRGQGAEFWNWVRGRPAGLAKVWLDGVAKPTLATSVPQIGAPAAWQRGLTGAGVTIGVLDSGVDGTHPDLAGKLLQQQDFTGTLPQGGDDLGHGTHVAGIIASGDSQYRGVAPDAKLLSGKVCLSFGCPDSMVIAGMEWIAPRAKVVNLSLGGDTTDGTDPVSTALNTLSAKHGTLFVVSSGNDRSLDPPDPLAGVTAPAAADAALAVGSVTAEDKPSPFTSHGPRFGDHAVKPDLAAPGSGIVSARVPGTPTGDAEPVGERHARASGTSMAAPHVTGAAALLLQKNPQWTVDRLKPQLMSSAKPTAGVFEQGAGRVDVDRAVSQSVWSSGSLGFGFLTYRQSATKKVRYHNDGRTPVTLTLALDPNPAFSLSANQITVPAGGSTEVTITARSNGAAGPQSTRLTGSAPGIAVRTAIGAVLEPESYNLTLKIRSRGGQFAAALAQAVDTATGAVTGPRFDATGTAVLRLPKGRYDLNALDLAANWTVVTLLSRTNLTLNRDTELTLDGTTATPVRATLDRPDARHQFGEFGLVSGERTGVRTSTLTWNSGPGQQLFAAATPGTVTDHVYAYFQRATYGPAHPADGPTPYLYHLAFLERGRIPATLDRRVRDHELARVDSRYHDQGAPTSGLRADYARLPVPGTTIGVFAPYLYSLPAKRIEYFTAHPDVTWQQLLGVRPADGSDVELHWVVRTLRPGYSTAAWNRAPLGPAFGDAEHGWGTQRTGDKLSVGVPLLSGNDPAVVTEPPQLGMTGRTTLSRDGQELGAADTAGLGVFTVPTTAGRYTVHTTATRSVPWSVLGTRADVRWTFNDSGVSGKPLPLLAIRATGQVDDHNRAPAGLPYLLHLTAHHQPGAPAAPLTALSAEVSYDDGATWRKAPVLRFGNSGYTLLNHPPGNGFATLRLAATDAGGNSVTQTVFRAYALSDR